MEDDNHGFEVVTGSTAHLTAPDSLGIYKANQVDDNTSVCPIPPGSPAYSSSSVSSPREHSSTPVNDFQQTYSFEPYRDNPEEVSTTQLLYTSFDGPIDTSNGKCPIGSEEDSDYHFNHSSRRHARKLWIASILSTFFFFLELSGGWITGSLALLSDSFHLLSDIISFAISLLSIYLARKPATRSHSYGYHRAEILGALASILLIWALTGYLCVEAYDRIQNPQEIDGPTMCLIASIGVVVNIVLLLVLGHHGHGHGHDSHGHDSHGHDSHSHDSHGHNHCGGDSVNVRSALLHVLGDFISSLGVLISSIVITIDSTKSWVDPLCTFFFSALVMCSTFGILRSSLRVLMEATPLHIDANAVRGDLEKIQGVSSVHDLHIWDLTVGRTTLTAHLQLRPHDPDSQEEPLMPTDVLAKARRMLKDKYGIFQVTIQVE
ncbi:cation efflux family-domain-containing protein [Gigaspora rosea]|uniref:Cation efflux family-domain-containing protein n=1 Tax=Gigaspora rosea TaxID=44941 RepID=A0A397UJX2_9GLOM|nr:cation efflux family-domain-containing protein [Gigaspora rosea]